VQAARRGRQHDGGTVGDLRAEARARLRRRVRVALVAFLATLLWPSAADAADRGWTWPLGAGEPVAVGRPFDPPSTRYGAGHRGVDLLAGPGAPVRAAGDGRVSYAGLLAGRGVVVVVHGDLRTTYEPVTADVAVGQLVAAGEPIGRLDAGHAGCPVEACLHWGLKRGEEYLDPLALLAAGPVRLLPLGGGPAASRPAAGPAAPPSPSASPPPLVVAAEPEPGGGWGPLAAAVSPTSLALLALLAVVALAVRRRPDPVPPADVGAAGARTSASITDLSAERARRRAG